MQRLVLALYLLAIALLPLAHHDIVCHLKSSTHCTSCVVASAGDLVSEVTPLGAATLHDAGGAGADSGEPLRSLSLPAAPGRAPPVVG
jgi:hypothetical protein